MSTPKKGMLAEFKDFIMTGDLVSIAVAFIIAGAVAKVIDSFVKDIALGIVGLFGKCKDAIGVDGKPTGEKVCSSIAEKHYKTVAWGSFINTVINFLILAAVVFLLVKAYKKARPDKPAAPAGPTDNELLTEIRDSLRSNVR